MVELTFHSGALGKISLDFARMRLTEVESQIRKLESVDLGRIFRDRRHRRYYSVDTFGNDQFCTTSRNLSYLRVEEIILREMVNALQNGNETEDLNRRYQGLLHEWHCEARYEMPEFPIKSVASYRENKVSFLQLKNQTDRRI